MSDCISLQIDQQFAIDEARLNRAAHVVLDFPAASLPNEIAAENRYLGDIVIALDYAAARARASGTDLGDVLCLLVAHATLHLLGYAHGTAIEREIMWAAQAQAFRKLGIDAGLATRYGGGDV